MKFVNWYAMLTSQTTLKPHAPMPRQDGFTIIEVIVVIVILAVTVAITVPSLISYIPEARLKCAARDLYSNLRLAKVSAIKDNASWAIVFDVDGGSYQVCSGQGADNTWNSPNIVEKTVVLSDYGSDVSYGTGSAATPVGTTFGNYVTYASPTDVAVLNARGTSNSGYVYLTNMAGTSCMAVGTRSSGLIRVLKWPW